MKKWVVVTAITLSIIGIGGYSGYQYFMDKAADKISEELSSNPNLIKELDKLEEDLKLTEEVQSGVAVSSGQASPASNQGTRTVSSQEQQNSEQAGGKTPAASSTSAKETAGQQAQSESEFGSKQEAVKFAMSRFSAAELNRFRQMASDGLTAEEKQELKAIAFSKFSKAEIEAVRQAVSN